ncbi:chitin-binding protein [Nocardiopsis sp. TSRI0078]|uniref:lytic polysaccharide monooxygenase n=1 Tax=unclassified Nocardiopsis TaxID=2649073 RepID=UPI00093D5252|nr:lytic polysaccharide monooxygenase [Nocardiopsis sp. TSRI0078]OKI17399.1 chitin-binding protein [Nocardiopsis sp. TSRI0078]
MRSRNAIALTVALGGLAVGTAVVALPDTAEAHGAFTYPASRTYACFQDATNGSSGGALAPTNDACADALAEGGNYPFWNWFGNLISNSDGRHQEFVADGELCGPTDSFSSFNAVRADWPTTRLEPGTTVEFHHNAWAAHPGTFYTYVTEDGFDPATDALTWDSLELIDEVTDPPLRSGGVEGAEYYWDVDLPDKQGQHIIYVVWERSDSPEAFYNCSDVVFGDGTDPGPEPTDPPTEEPTDPDPEPTDPPTEEPTDPPQGEYCRAEYSVVNEWSTGFQAEVEVTAGESGVDGWMVDWVFANGQEVNNSWNASLVNHDAHIEATNSAHNGTLAPGESTSFGFTATHGGVNTAPAVDCQES